MDVKKLKETIEKRILTDEEYDYGLKQCWDAMADILLSDIPGAVEFLQTCTDKELYWITECFIELFDKKPSREIYDAVEKRCETIRNKEYRRSIKVELDFVRWTLKSDTDEDGQEDGQEAENGSIGNGTDENGTDENGIGNKDNECENKKTSCPAFKKENSAADMEKLREAIKEQNLYMPEDRERERCRNTITEILSGDISGAIEFLQTCSEKEFFWTLECLPEIIEKTASREIFETAEKRNETMKNRQEKELNYTDLKYAKRTLLHLLGEDEGEQEDTDEKTPAANRSA